MSDETFFDLELECNSEADFELLCWAIFEEKDYYYTLSDK